MVKKIRIISALFIIVCVLTSFAFAENNTYTFIVSDVEYNGESSIEVVIKTDKIITENISLSAVLSYDTDIWEYVSGGSGILPNGVNFIKEGTVSSEVLATVKFNLKAGKTIEDVKNSSVPFVYTLGEVYDSKSFEDIGVANADRKAIGNVIIKKTDVVVPAEENTTIATKDATYTDVVNFSSSLTNVTATNPTLTFDLYENGVKHNVKPYEVNLGNGVTLDGSTLNFKIVVLGAPTDTTITLVNPAVK